MQTGRKLVECATGEIMERRTAQGGVVIVRVHTPTMLDSEPVARFTNYGDESRVYVDLNRDADWRPSPICGSPQP